MAIKFARLAGTLTLGATPLDVSAQVVGVTINSEVSTGDALTVLTGEQLSSGLSTASTMDGTLILDPYAGGVGEYTWDNHGTTQPFSLTVDTPSAVAGLVVTGDVLVTRLAIGSDAYGNVLQSDFSWTIEGDVEVTWPTAAAAV